ncbi:EAL domain-containing protein [Alphaproteobacteria bacterium GH1-50]|uniref:EAL domain-containing protein n=1 Tax=Kangsaoukella pontilimi TaxID=2691042 RepID=A0A7C9MXW8_9RHOB|nr:EAL domain-containing protein [Kangsaoukella pontilimi]
MSADFKDMMPWRLMLASGIGVFLLIKTFLAAPMMQSMLISSFDTNGERWSRYFAAQMDGFEMCLADTPPGAQFEGLSDRHSTFAMTLQAALAAGSIKQIDVLKKDCDCKITLLSPDPAATLSADVERENLELLLQAFHRLLAHQIHGDLVLGDPDRAVSLPTPSVDGEGLEHEVFQMLGAAGNKTWLGSTTTTTTNIADEDHGAHGILEQGVVDHGVMIRLITDVTSAASNLAVLFWSLAVGASCLTAVLVYVATRLLHRSHRHGEMSERQARYLAEHDSLTGLLNRRGFHSRAEAMIAKAHREGKRLCLAQIDLDKFKDINDLHGHAAGDEMLLSVTGMIRRVFPENALAARLGGDEFAVLIMEGQVANGCENFLEGVDTSVVATMDLDGAHHTLMATTSIGYAFYPRDGKTLFELMKASDLALYNVKREGRNATGRYHPNLGRAFERRIWEIDGILMAAQTSQIVPYYQPLVNARTLEIEGFESLVRWKHPKLGLLTPERFSNALRDSAACRAVTRAMLQIITDDLARWHEKGHKFSVGLNIAEADLKNPDFVDDVVSTLDKKGLPHRSLAIEVTEQAANRFNLDVLAEQLTRFREHGMFVALDDFGTDGSSLTILKNLPCTAMKIDKSFVSGMTTDMDDLSIVRSLIDLGHDLGLKIVAEGVESEHQRKVLVNAGADLLQGYLFGKPVEAAVIDQMLTNWPVARVVTTRAA